METLIIVVSMLLLAIYFILPTKQTKNNASRTKKDKTNNKNAKDYFRRLKRIEERMVASS